MLVRISGKGGDLLYRSANPFTYDRVSASDQQLIHTKELLSLVLPNLGKEIYDLKFSKENRILQFNKISVL
jgi:hypothetical protein